MDNFVSNREQRILIFNQFFPPDFAATGQLIEELALGISRTGIKVRVFSGQPGYAFETNQAPREEKKGRLNIRRTRTTQLIRWRLLAKLCSSIFYFIRAFLHTARHQKKEDLLIITTAPAFMTWLGYLANFFWDKKYICLLYDLYPNVLTSLNIVSEENPIVRLWNLFNRHTWLRAESIIVLSSSMKQRIIEACPEVTHKIHIIHNWSDGNIIKPMDKQNNWFAKEHDLQDKFTILYSGNMGRCHDMETIVGAAKLLEDCQDQFEFVFIGSGAQQLAIQNQANELGLQNFTFLAYQPKDVLPFSLTACDLSLISMTRRMEGVVAPSKLYSTLAAGNAVGVICPQKSFLAQLVVDAECGESFRNGEVRELADFIVKLKQNSQLCKEMGYNARQYFSNHFTKTIAINKYLEVIDKAGVKVPYCTASR